MKIMILFLLLISSCWSASEYPGSKKLNIQVEQICESPSQLQAEYDEAAATIFAQWESSSSSPMHYIISLDGMPYQVVPTNNALDSLSNITHLFIDVPLGLHTACVRSVCIESEDGLLTPFSSEEVCITLGLGYAEHSRLPEKERGSNNDLRMMDKLVEN